MNIELTATKMTAEQFGEWVELPENSNKWFELVRGEVIELPPPMKRHGIVSSNAGYELMNYVKKNGRGYIAGNVAGVVLERDSDTVRGPDIAYYEDAKSYDDIDPNKYGEVPPRLAVEVLSPNDRADRILPKINDYLQNGAEIVWVVNPERRHVQVYSPDKAVETYGEEDTITAEEVLPGFESKVIEFFRLPGEQAEENSPP